MSEGTFEQVYGVLIDALTGPVGNATSRRWSVGPESRFEADLELESMEIAELAEQLMAGTAPTSTSWPGSPTRSSSSWSS